MMCSTICAFSAAVVCVDGYEADDVIATLAARHRGEGVDVLTGDKDLLQLAAYDGERILDPQGDPVDAAKKFGVPPGRIGDYLALVGAASDNVAGVSGCGPKSPVAFGAQIDFRDAMRSTGSTYPGLMSQECIKICAHGREIDVWRR